MDILTGARKNDRLAATLLLVFVALLIGAIFIDIHALWMADRLIDVYNGRWSGYADRGEKLLAEGQFEEAVVYLADLDRRFPARHAKHALDRDRERVLMALGQAYEQTGRRRLARETYARLVLFDPRNFNNHYALAACLVRQGRSEEALEPLARVMEINPSHLPSVRLLVETHFDSGEWDEVIEIWETYLDALVFGEVSLKWSETVAGVRVPVDGRLHQLEMDLSVPGAEAGQSDSRVLLTTQGYAFELGGIQVRSRAQPPPSTSISSITVRPAPGQQIPRSGSVFLPRSGDEGVWLEAESDRLAVDHWRMDIRLLKVSDEATWRQVAKSYQNVLDFEGLEEARARSQIVGGSDL